jgi:hypothetical protein
MIKSNFFTSFLLIGLLFFSGCGIKQQNKKDSLDIPSNQVSADLQESKHKNEKNTTKTGENEISIILKNFALLIEEGKIIESSYFIVSYEKESFVKKMLELQKVYNNGPKDIASNIKQAKFKEKVNDDNLIYYYMQKTEPDRPDKIEVTFNIEKEDGEWKISGL